MDATAWAALVSGVAVMITVVGTAWRGGARLQLMQDRISALEKLVGDLEVTLHQLTRRLGWSIWPAAQSPSISPGQSEKQHPREPGR